MTYLLALRAEMQRHLRRERVFRDRDAPLDSFNEILD